MANLHVVGNTLMGQDEFQERLLSGDLERLAREPGRADSMIFRHGTVNGKELAAKQMEVIPDFQPIDLGRPLSLEVLSMYTGDAPRKRLFGGHPDMLLATATKGPLTHEVAPRAINQIVRSVEDQHLYEPGALHEGSPIVYYTKAAEASTLFFSVELVTESFNRNVFEFMENLFRRAAQIPIFSFASSYLMAGSSIIKVAGDLGKHLFESKPFLRSDYDLRFDTPGLRKAMSQMLVLVNDEDVREFEGYRVARVSNQFGDDRVALVHRQKGWEYLGRAPYVILSLDGRERHELEEFAPRLATASIMEKYFGEGIDNPAIDTLDEAMRLYNDFQYRRKAIRLKKSLRQMDSTAPGYDDLLQLLDAYVRNIGNDFLKPNWEATSPAPKAAENT